MRYSSMRIIEIEDHIGIRSIPEDPSLSSLSTWYGNIRNKTLGELSDGDIARMIRQSLYLQFVIVEALGRLSENPMAGEMYGGEIVDAMSGIDAAYWTGDSTSREMVVNQINVIRKQLDTGLSCTTTEDTQDYVSWLTKLENQISGGTDLQKPKM